MKASDLMIGDWVVNTEFGKNKIDKIETLEPRRVWLEHGRTYVPIEFVEPIPLTTEILEKNGFKKDAFTNLSPDYYYGDNVCSICINLNSTCDKGKSIWVENRNSKVSVSIEESRHSLQKKPLLTHQLQHALRLCGIEKQIML